MWVMSEENDSIKISKQWKSATIDDETNKWWLITAGVSKETKIALNMTDNQERENSYHSSYVQEDFISAVILIIDLMKILVGLGIFNRVIFKDLESDCYCQNSISPWAGQCLFF